MGKLRFVRACRRSIIDSCPYSYQAEDWVQERVQQLRQPIPPGDLKDNWKHLQKHQAFEAEVKALEQALISVAKVMPGLGLSLPQVQMARWARGKVSGRDSEQASFSVPSLTSKVRLSWLKATLGQERSPRGCRHCRRVGRS